MKKQPVNEILSVYGATVSDDGSVSSFGRETGIFVEETSPMTYEIKENNSEDFSLDSVDSILKEYGSGLSDDGTILNQSGEKTGVRVLIRRKRGGRRLIFESVNTGNVLSIGALNRGMVEEFVEGFWVWKKIKN